MNQKINICLPIQTLKSVQHSVPTNNHWTRCLEHSHSQARFHSNISDGCFLFVFLGGGGVLLGGVGVVGFALFVFLFFNHLFFLTDYKSYS